MAVQKERKSKFFTAFERREKEAFDIAVVAEYLCHLKAQYRIQSQNLCNGKQILLFVHPVSATG